MLLTCIVVPWPSPPSSGSRSATARCRAACPSAWRTPAPRSCGPPRTPRNSLSGATVRTVIDETRLTVAGSGDAARAAGEARFELVTPTASASAVQARTGAVLSPGRRGAGPLRRALGRPHRRVRRPGAALPQLRRGVGTSRRAGAHGRAGRLGRSGTGHRWRGARRLLVPARRRRARGTGGGPPGAAGVGHGRVRQAHLRPRGHRRHPARLVALAAFAAVLSAPGPLAYARTVYSPG